MAQPDYTSTPTGAATEQRVTPAVSETLVLWPVVEEHLDEATFLLEQHGKALYSPDFTLEVLANTLEARLEAHLDGLVVGGVTVLERLLVPALADDVSPERSCAAALAILNLGAESGLDELASLVLMQAWDGESGHPGIQRALTLWQGSSLNPLLLQHFSAAASAPERAFWLDILAARSVDPGPGLESWIQSEKVLAPAVVRSLLQALCRFGRPHAATVAERALSLTEPMLREAAILSGLLSGSRLAWQHARQLASAWTQAQAPTTPTLFSILELVALVGGPQEHLLLAEGLKLPQTRLESLWLLGFTGTVASADQLLPHLNDEDARVQKAAAEALSWIGGFDLNEQAFYRVEEPPSEEDSLPLLESEDLENPLLSDGFDALPLPQAESIRAWWEQNRSRFQAHAVWLRGQPLSQTSMGDALQTAPLWRRHGLARALTIRSGGAIRLTTDVFAPRQLRELADARARLATPVAGRR